MGAVDQRCALSRPALLSAPDKKSLVNVSSPILACNVLTSTAGVAGSDLGSEPNTPAAPSRSPPQELRQFGQRLLAPHGGQSHLRFESRRVVPAGSSSHRLSCSTAILAAVRQKLVWG